MSFLQDSAEACERILIKHEPATDRLNRIRVTPATLRAVVAEGFTVAAPGPIRVSTGKRTCVWRVQRPAKIAAMRAATAWLDQPVKDANQPGHRRVGEFAKECGVTVRYVYLKIHEIKQERRRAARDPAKAAA